MALVPMWAEIPTNAAVSTGSKLAYSHRKKVIIPINADTVISTTQRLSKSLHDIPSFILVNVRTVPPNTDKPTTHKYVSNE